MRYSLLDYICCSYCGGDLSGMIPPSGPEGSTGDAPYVMVKTSPSFHKDTPIVGMLKKLESAANAVNVEQEDSTDVEKGLLICGECGHWFPIHNYVPELLPDHIRDWERDIENFKSMEALLPTDLFNELTEKSSIFASQVFAVEDGGVGYKKNEIAIEDKVTDPHFFGPGYVAPFNPGNTDYTIHLIRRLGNVLPLLELKQGDVVLDIGAGYAWTTEWLMRMGVEPIGVDICRTYLDIAVERLKDKRPHLVVGDIENLPLKADSLNGVLCYDAFHHIPDRKKGMGNFFKGLKDYGNVVLAEPGGTHEFAKVSRDVMDKYGILEKGMELDEVIDYCNGLKVMPPEQHFILRVNRTEANATLSEEFIHSHSYVDCNVFVVKKRLGEREILSPTSKLKRRVKRQLKRILKKFFFKLFH